ncbi:MAG: hypothetical protein ACFCUS_00005 [Rubrimonas sp.]
MSDSSAYLITFNDQMLDRDAFKAFLNGERSVKDWILFMPGAFAVKIRSSKRELYEAIRKEFPNLHFVIAELTSDGSTGVAPKPVWDFIQRKPEPAF